MASDLDSILSSTSGTTASNTSSTVSREQLDALNSLSSNFDNFLTILTTQLQNQDPLSPLDTHEFTNQLVMFADVEQSVRQSGQLDDLIALQRQNEASAAVGYIGQKIQANYNETYFDGANSMDLTYFLPEQADTASLQIFNANGELVRLINADEAFGSHTITWDGTDENGNILDPGAYAFQIGAVNADDQPIEARYETEGAVTGVEMQDGITTLLMGDVRVPLERVLRVQDPNA